MLSTDARIVRVLAVETLKIDKDHWPDFGDQVWVEAVHNHYGSKPYWD